MSARGPAEDQLNKYKKSLKVCDNSTILKSFFFFVLVLKGKCTIVYF